MQPVWLAMELRRQQEPLQMHLADWLMHFSKDLLETTIRISKESPNNTLINMNFNNSEPSTGSILHK
jgi:hypothetical protein